MKYLCGSFAHDDLLTADQKIRLQEIVSNEDTYKPENKNPKTGFWFCRVDSFVIEWDREYTGMIPRIVSIVDTDSEWLPININRYARVKFTEEGLKQFAAIMRRKNEDMRGVYKTPSKPVYEYPLEPKLDSEGYYNCQLYELMHDFGHLLYNGCFIPFSTEIQVKVR